MIAQILALALSAAASTPQDAPSQVYRCHGVHGEVVFSGMPCRDRSDLQQESGYDNAFDSQDGWGGHCPDTAQGLSDRVASYFDSGNVNDLGALFLWQGYRTRAAYKHLNALRTMLGKALTGLQLVPAVSDTWRNHGPVQPAMPASLRVEVAVPGMGRTTQVWLFPVVERDGCFWLEYAPMQEPPFP